MLVFFVSSYLVEFRLGASLLREASYSAIRMGAYEPIKWQLGAHDPNHTPFVKKLTAGAISGDYVIAAPFLLLVV